MIRPAEAGALYRVNINTAGAGELAALPGIGPKTAEKIVEYRREHEKDGRPGFTTTQELLDAKLVPKNVFRRIEGSITVGEGQGP